MAREPQSVRFGIEEHKLIADEMAAANVCFSEATRRLIHRGAGKPEPIYLRAQISCQPELDAFIKQSEAWRRQWADIGSLVRATLPPTADEETKKLVTTAQATAKKLLPQALELGAVAAGLSKKMTGIGPENLARLQSCKRYLGGIVATNKKRAAEGDPKALSPETLQDLEMVVTVLKGLGI